MKKKHLTSKSMFQFETCLIQPELQFMLERDCHSTVTSSLLGCVIIFVKVYINITYSDSYSFDLALLDNNVIVRYSQSLPLIQW